MTIIDHQQAAQSAATQAMMQQEECSYRGFGGGIECDVHSEDFLDVEPGIIYGHLTEVGGYCPVSRKRATEILTAATPHLRAGIAEEVLALPRFRFRGSYIEEEAYNRAISDVLELLEGGKE